MRRQEKQEMRCRSRAFIYELWVTTESKLGDAEKDEDTGCVEVNKTAV